MSENSLQGVHLKGNMSSIFLLKVAAGLQEKYRKLEYFSAVALLMPRSEVPSNGLGDSLAAVSGTHKVVPNSTPSCGEVHSGR